MRNGTRFVLCVALLSAGCGRDATPSDPLRLFVFAGQSNAEGVGDADALPAALRAQAPGRLAFDSDGGWRPLAPEPRQYAELGIARAAFGPELVFAAEVERARPGAPLGVVKVVEGGTALDAWSPSGGGSPRLYRELVARVEAARRSRPTSLRALVWIQGEADARDAVAAARWEGRFETLVESLRRDLDAPGLPVLYARVQADPRDYPYIERVRDAQTRALAAVAPARLVPTGDLSRYADGVHLDSEGQRALGERLAQAYLSLDAP